MKARFLAFSLIIALVFVISEEGYACPVCPTPSTPSLSSPPDGETCVSTAAGITLDWSDVTCDSYRVYMSYTDTSPDGNDLVASPPGSSWPTGARAPGKTYYWRVRAYNNCGTYSNYSSTRSFTTKPGQANNPNPINGATNVSITTDLSWAAGSGATSHDVYLGTSYDAVNNANNSSPEFKGNVTTATFDPGMLDYSTTYYWRIDEKDSHNCTRKGQLWSFTTEAFPPPAAPSGLTASAVSGFPSWIKLSWTDNSSNEIGFKIQRATNSGGPWPQIGTVEIGVTYYDVGLNSSNVYYYRVCAYNAGGSSCSNEDNNSPCPSNPQGLIPTAGERKVDLDWDDNPETDIVGAGYNVYRSTERGGPYNKVNASLISQSAYSDGGLTDDTTYYYVVRAVDTLSNESGYSDERDATPQDLPPDAPNLLVATPGNGSVQLDWNYDLPSDFDHYNVYRAVVSGGPYELIADDVSGETYTDSVPSANAQNITYYYVVTAVDAGSNESLHSNEDNASLTYYVRNLSRGIWYITIQLAINNAMNNETIEASTGMTYSENLRFTDKKITLTSAEPAVPASTFIDGGNSDTVITFNPGDADSTIIGFTIQNGSTITDGGGIYCNGASPTITGCVISGNDASNNGGGLYISDGSVTLIETVFKDNHANSGGAIYGNSGASVSIKDCNLGQAAQGNTATQGGGALSGCSGSIHNSIIAHNSGGSGAGAISNSTVEILNSVIMENTGCNIEGSATALDNCDGDIINCTIVSNTEGTGVPRGGLINCEGQIKNCIIWGNGDGTTDQLVNCSTPTYCCIQDYNDAGSNGNINSDPSLDADGYHLTSSSPCIDAGDPDYLPVEDETDIDGDWRLRATSVDMGAHEYGKVIYVDNSIGTSGNGLSWDTPYKYLRDALNSTVTQLDSGDEIWVADGTYYPDEDTANPDGTDDRNSTFQLVEKVAIYGGFAGGPDGETDLKQRNLKDNKCILSGDLDDSDVDGMPDSGNSYHVVTGANNSLIDGFTITAGYADDTTSYGGAGLLCDDTSPIVYDCNLVKNMARGSRFGGAVHTRIGSSPLFVNCLFSGNFAQGNRAGAIYHSGVTLTLVNCTVADNAGDGIHCNDANMQMDNCIVWRNRFKPDDSAYSLREIVLTNSAHADIYYSNVEEGQNGVVAEAGTTLNSDLLPDSAPDPQVKAWGTWTWELADGTQLEVGVTELEVDPCEVTIYDVTDNCTNFARGHDHDEDDFVAEMLQNKRPVWDPEPGQTSTVSNEADFNLWFNSSTGGEKRGPVHKNVEVPWICSDSEDGIFRFDSNHFFPIDDWCDDPNYGCGEDPDCTRFCNEQQKIACYDPDTFHAGDTGKKHNYFFTLQYHTQCTYVPGQTLSFESSDDLFVAINDHVVVNRGGYYNGYGPDEGPSETVLTFQNGDVTIDYISPVRPSETVTLGLEPHAIYDFDLFFAQRHTDFSVLVVERSPGDQEMIPVFSSGNYHLTSGSPCIDAGDNMAVPIIIDTDIESWPRFIDDPATIDNGNRDPEDPRPYVDMGAYELQVPIAVDDEYSISKNDVLNIAVQGVPPGVLDNDEDPWGDPIEAILVSPPSHGFLTPALNPDGSFSYTPEPDYAGTDSFTYKAQSTVDGRESTPATVTITVREHPPSAYAGPDQTLFVCNTDESTSVMLDGSGSTDPDNDIVSYEWTWTENSEPKSATGETVQVLMSADGGSPYEVVLTVTDSIGDPATDIVQITISVLTPVAIPGSDFEVEDGGAGDDDHAVDAGANVTLDGSASTGNGLTYIWYVGGAEIAQGPTPTVRLGIGIYTIGLLVIDECGRSDYEEVVVTVCWPYLEAQIDAGEPQEIWLPFDGSEQLNGSDTVELDPDNIITRYEWKVIDVPDGGYVAAWPEGIDRLDPNVTLADGITGEYKFMLIGKDDTYVEIDRDTTSIIVKSSPASNKRPEVTAWILVDSQKLKEHTITSPTPPGTVTLQGTITDDGQLSGELTGTWKQLSGPINGVQISPLTESCSRRCKNLEVTATATFTQEGTYQLSLTGDDGTLSNTDVVVVYFESGQPPYIEAGGNDPGVLDSGQADVPMSDADVTDRDLPFDNTSQLWTLIDGDPADVEFLDASGQPAGDTSTLEKPTIRFFAEGKYQFKLEATDAIVGAGTPDTAWVTITEDPPTPPQPCVTTALFAGVSRKNVSEATVGGDVYRRLAGAASWERITTDGTFNGPVLSLCAYDGYIYAATRALTGKAEVRRLQGAASWVKVSEDTWDGFDIYQINGLKVFQNQLHACTGTYSSFDMGGEPGRMARYDKNTGLWDVLEGVHFIDYDDYDYYQAGIASMLNWGDYLYFGNINADQIARYSGAATEDVMNVSGSCIYDFAIFQNDIYACAYAEYGDYFTSPLYYSDNGDPDPFSWDLAAEIGYEHCWTLTVFDNLLYVGEGPYLHSSNNGTSFSRVTDNGADWEAENGELLSLLPYGDELFIGTGVAGRMESLGNGTQGRVYKLWVDGSQVTQIENYSEGQGMDPAVVKGVQCLISAAATCEPEYLTMRVTAYAEDTVDPSGWVDATTKFVSPEDFDRDEIKYEITIDPDVQPDAQGLVLTVMLPDTVDFVRVGIGDFGAYDSDSHAVIWLLGDVTTVVTHELVVKVNDHSVPGQTITTVFGLENDNFQLIANDNSPKVDCWGTSILYVDQSNTSGLKNGRSWETALDNLSGALDYAAASGCYSEIWVAAGTYTPQGTDPAATFFVPDGISIYGGFAGDESDLSERDFRSALNQTILSGAGLHDYVVTVEGVATVDGFSIQGGVKAGVVFDNASPTISHCYVSGNGSGTAGDAGVHVGGTSTAEILNCVIYSNSGDGIYIADTASPMIRNNTIAENSGYGVTDTSASLTVYNCILWSNTTGPQSGCTLDHCYTDAANPFDPARPPYHLRSDATDCIDQGLDELTGVWAIGNDETDIDGEARIVGGTVDIGADEFPPIWVDAGDTIFEEIPVGASSVQVDFESASILSNGGVDVPTNLSYQWYCIGYPVGGSCPGFVPGTDSELYASATFSSEGWYLFLLQVMDLNNGNAVVGADLLWVRIDIGVEIVVNGKSPVSGVADDVTYEAYVDEELGLSANFGPPSPLPDHVEWWAPYEPVAIGDPTQVNTTISFDTPGRYPLELYALNVGNEVIGKDRVWIDVRYPQIEISAGPDRVLYLQKNVDVWEVSDQFHGSVDGINITSADRVEWSVEAANDDADVASVTVVPNPANPSMADITFRHYGAYFVLFSAWKNTSQGEVFLGTGVAVTVVTYQQVELDAGTYPDDPDVSVISAPATFNLQGEVVQGQVDSVEWVFTDPEAPAGLVTFASPESLGTMVSFNSVGGYSGAGTYPITLLGKIRINGEDVIVASHTVDITVEVTGGGGGDFTQTICITTENDEASGALPLTGQVWATIEEGSCGSGTPFEDYDYAVWSWSGTDNSVIVNQPDQGVPVADVTFNRAGDYILTLVVKNGESLIATKSHPITVDEESCTISAEAGFDSGRTQKVFEDIAIGSTIDLYGQILNDCVDTQIEHYWSCGGSSDAVDLVPVDTEEPNVQAQVTFTEPGGYPLTLHVVNAQTQELLAFETIYASVAPPLFWLDISGPRITAPQEFPVDLPLTATILGGAPAGSTCTWSTNDSGVTLPDPAEVPSGTEVIFGFDAVGTYELTVMGNVSDPAWSQTATVTVWVSEDLSEIETIWNAGSTKYVTLPEPAYMSDAVFVTNEASIVPKWSLVSGPADVIFLPDDSSEKPYVVFSEEGQYRLSLVPWDLQTQAQLPDTDASIVDVFVDMPIVQNPDAPEVTLEITDGPSNNLKILTATANDKDGVAQLLLKLGDEVLANASGAPAFNQDLTLGHTLDISHLPVGTSYVRAYAWDTAANLGQSVQVACENNSAIRDFQVNPETINNFTGPDLIFTASFDGVPRAWELVIIKADGSSVATYAGENDLNLEDGRAPVSTVGWSNGNYSAVLTVTDTGTGDTGEVHFRIWRDRIYSSQVIADLNSFIGENSGEIFLYDDFDVEDFIGGSSFESPLPVIKDGHGSVWAKLGHPDFPDDVEYRLRIGTVVENYFVSIQVVTPSDVPHDAQGWASKSSDGDVVEDLGTVDLSMLENGNYYMELAVWCNGVTVYDYAQFILDCPLKIGNVKFSQEDLVIETGGIPLRVVRTYDSFRKHKDGEFGHGWTYSIANMDIELDESRTTMYETDFDLSELGDERSVRFGGNVTKRNVTLTLPDGRRTTFMFYLKHSGSYKGLLPLYAAKYEAMPGIDANLRTLQEEMLAVDLMKRYYCWQGVAEGLIGGLSIDPAQYDFSGYVLTTADGTEYYFEREDLTNGPDYFTYGMDSIGIYYTVVRGPLYLTRIKTVDGEEILLNTNLVSGKIGANGGIECKDAQGNVTKSLEIKYYTSEPNKDRIWYINAPSEVGQLPDTGTPTLVYEYDDEGNLEYVKKLVNKNGTTEDEKYDITEYVYDDDHYVTDIIDERGLTPIRYFYDAAGRLTEIVDAKGNRIVIQHGAIADNGDKAEVVYERWDTEQLYPTVYAYNDRGNVTLVQKNEVGKTDPLEETHYFYEDPLYPDGPSRIQQLVPDPTDPTQSVVAETRYEYDEHGKTTLTVDPLGNATIITGYDLYGNVLEIIQAKNYVNSTTYDTVSITRNTYEGNKLKTTEIRDAADTATLNMTVNIYDNLNRVLNIIQVDVDKVTDFDNFRNLQDVTLLPSLGEDPTSHSITTCCYVGNLLQPEWVEGPSGARTSFEYDQNGRQKYSYYKWTDPEGIQDLYVFTKNTYDDQGRVTKTERIVDVDTDPTGVEPETVLSETKYNSLGKVDFTINQYNNVTKYEYDQIGNLVETRTFSTAAYNIGIDPQGQIVEYDSGGTVVQTHGYFAAFETDADTSHLTTTRTLYDTEGRAWLTVGPYDPAVYQQATSDWPAGTETVYDVLGRVIETRRWASVIVDLVPFKVESSGQAVPCQPDDTDMVGKMIPPGVYVEHAWNGTGTQPGSIGWTSEEQLPVVALSVGDGQIGPLSYSRTVYDAGGRVKHSAALDEAGYEQPTTYYYDVAGKQKEIIAPQGHKLDDLTYPLYSQGIALYDGATNATAIDFGNFDDNLYDQSTYPQGNVTGNHKTVTQYDGTRRSSVTDARGNMTSFQYDALGRLIRTEHPQAEYYNEYKSPTPGYETGKTYTHVGYDGLGRKAWQSNQVPQEFGTAASVPDDEVRDFEYDEAGRLIGVELPDPDGDGIDIPYYRYIYDERGNQVGILDAEDRLTVFEYDEFGHQTAKYMPFVPTDPAPADIDTAEEVYTALSNADPTPDAEYRDYDEFGRLERHTDYARQDTGYFYNSKGQLEYKKYYEFVDVDPEDGENDNYPDNPAETISYTYDKLGRKETITDSRGTTTYVYDVEGRVVQVDTPEGTVNYTYDAVTGRKGNTSTASGNTNTNYFYDKMGRLAGTGTASEDTYYHYDEVGNRKWLCIDADGGFDGSDPAAPTGYEIKTDYTYDQMNRLTNLIQQRATGTPTQLAGYPYKLYADGMRHKLDDESILLAGGTTEARDITYEYDNLNRLTDETADSSGDGYDIDYTYDLVGNRTQRVINVNGQTLTTDYTYYTGTDKLQKETHTGPVYGFIHGNERYYAYAGTGGGQFYIDSQGRKIGAIRAFFMGLPSVWNKYLFILAMALVPILLFGPALLKLTSRMLLCYSKPTKLKLHVPRKGICLLVAFVMLFGPEGFQQVAQADVQYANLSTASWANGDTTITYTYDANGSVETKTTVTSSVVKEVVTNHYNIAGRLSRMVTDSDADSGTNSVDVVDYTYNDDGIRVKKYTFNIAQNYLDDVDEQTYATDQQTTVYLIDSYNHTGYAQTLEELTFDKANPDPLIETPDSLRTYLIGDDIIAQNTDGTVEYLLYDGHGSTRQLAEYDGSVTIVDTYSYDGYGVLLQNDSVASSNPGKVGAQVTNLLYAGEHFDTDAQQYYLRARWYNPLSGLFNRIDPYSGNNQDPQSLHKYLYVHNNPVNSVDPSGMYSIGEMVCVAGIIGSISAIVAGEVVRIKGGTEQQIAKAQWKWFWIGFFATAIVYSLVWTIHSIWLWLYGGGQVASNPEVQTHLHHFATNKHSYWTPQYEDIISKYGLKLNEAWNLNPFSTQYHSGPHPEAYHQWVFEQMTRAAHQAGESAIRFIVLFHEYVILPVMENPEMLKPEFWPKGG